MVRRFLACRLVEIRRKYIMLDHVVDGCEGHGPIHSLVSGVGRLAGLGVWSCMFGRLGLPGSVILEA